MSVKLNHGRQRGVPPLWRWPSLSWLLLAIPFGFVTSRIFPGETASAVAALVGCAIGAGMWFVLVWASFRKSQ